MQLYGGVADGAFTVKSYQKQWVDRLLDASGNAQDAADLQRHQIEIVVANQNLAFANDVMGLILKNISQLQP